VSAAGERLTPALAALLDKICDPLPGMLADAYDLALQVAVRVDDLRPEDAGDDADDWFDLQSDADDLISLISDLGDMAGGER
jgi:hypothetical protein